ncbi:hypothetical protein BC628DRAFT_244831 [Trametes gibbosa]|nr:hypothetical protein BC628DRAFT_244831 [Trametes gibbosa]
MPLTLADVPEEILERILALILVQSPELSLRPAWHPYSTPSTSAGHANIISPLLVSRTWLRIATPIHYRHPVLRTPRHADLLLRALRHTPALAHCVRSLHVHATSPALRDLVAICANLHSLDITVDNADGQSQSQSASASAAPGLPEHHARDGRVLEFCEAFARTRSVRHLTIRKNAYLTQPNATYVFEQLAKAIVRWHKLETVNVAFRLSPSPAASALTHALAAAPRLHTLYTQLPAVWNTTLLDIAQNPALARIVLSPGAEHAGAHLFLAEAKRHPRLVELIRAGAAPPSPAPSPYPGRAPAAVPAGVSFSLAGNARARAASAVMGPGRAPMPVPTWGYERDVPAPTCPPSSRRAHGPVAAPQYAYGPSAYGHGHAHGPAPSPSMRVPVPVAPSALAASQAQRRAAGSRRMTAS